MTACGSLLTNHEEPSLLVESSQSVCNRWNLQLFDVSCFQALEGILGERQRALNDFSAAMKYGHPVGACLPSSKTHVFLIPKLCY